MVAIYCFEFMSAMQYETSNMSNSLSFRVATCGTHHINADNTPLYKLRFDEVLPFHIAAKDLELAPACSGGVAWHIYPDGFPAYEYRFDRTFGFYCGLAAVSIGNEWFHIGSIGQPIYSGRYAFAGNYQSDIAVVCDHDGFYFHIGTDGIPLYTERWQYCGDFREGIAVVQSESGLSTHIHKDGGWLHNQWFMDLDVFHKGFARAKDKRGWHHIDRNGQSFYLQRYASVEAFYNGCARVETFDGALLVIDECGRTLRRLREATIDHFDALSAEMVGYWRTFTIATAVEFGIFDNLPANTIELAAATGTPPERLERLLRALVEMQLLKYEEGNWSAQPKGVFLARNHTLSLATAALEYRGDLMNRWHSLPTIIEGEPAREDIFRVVASDPQRVRDHHAMLRSYALHDYTELVPLLDIKSGDQVLDAGGGNGILTEMLESTFPEARVLLGDLPEVIESSKAKHCIAFDLFEPWPITADKIILARVLHDWSDAKAMQILKLAAQALAENGLLYVMEMLLIDNDYGGSLCDLHLLAISGGKERTLDQFMLLADSAGLKLSHTIKDKGLVSILCFTRKVENQ